MDSRNRIGLLALMLAVIVGLACNSTGTATPAADRRATEVADAVRATLSAVPPTLEAEPGPTPSVEPSEAPPTDPAPTTEPASPEPQPPTPTFEPIPDEYSVAEERLVNGYLLQIWRDVAEDAPLFGGVATISRDGVQLAQVMFATEFGMRTGEDLTGEGHPDAVIEAYTGGAHCCFSTHVYDLGPELRQVLATRESNCAGTLEDLEGDGVYEFVTCDDSFAYVYCSYAASPAVKVIMVYEPGTGYVPASSRYPAQYEAAIAQHTQEAAEAAPGDRGEWDGTNKCSVLPLMLDYLYTGRSEEAWQALEANYPHDDRLVFWAEVIQTVEASQLHEGDAQNAGADLPAYHMLQLLTNCGPEWRVVGLLQEGDDPCASTVPHRDVFWLQWHLRDTDLLSQDERLELVPEDCTLNCRLDVVGDDDARVGSILLETASEYPGAVYRVNGSESDRWRLRGDLTWEHLGP